MSVPEGGADTENPIDELSGFERFSVWLNHHQWFPLVMVGLGLVLFFVDPRLAWDVIGGAVVTAGLYPVITGWYRGPFGLLEGWKARARGVVSVGLGAAIILLM